MNYIIFEYFPKALKHWVLQDFPLPLYLGVRLVNHLLVHHKGLSPVHYVYATHSEWLG
jgi:hypothetical protein